MKFENKYEINGELLVMTALHIGSGLDDAKSDSPFIKLSKNGSYYIPGSSFRGYLRTKMERYVSEKNEYNIFFKAQKINAEDIKNLFGYVEGRSAKSGKIFIQDMLIMTEKKEGENFTTIKRDGIKVSRETGTTEKGAKFDYDVITRGHIFDFKIIIENVTEKELALLFIALNEIFSEDGDLIGGKISRGIGRCRIENVSLKFIESKDLEHFKSFLLTKKMMEKNINKFKEELFANISIN